MRQRETCVYCHASLAVRFLERLPSGDEGWQCRSLAACARRSNAAGRDNYGR